MDECFADSPDGTQSSEIEFEDNKEPPDEIRRGVVREGFAASILAYSTNFDWNQCWNNDVVSSFPTGSSDEEGSEQEELQVVELEYACVSNEYSERDEWWLFSPENPDAERWIEASTLERLKIESYGAYRVLNENEKLPPASSLSQ